MAIQNVLMELGAVLLLVSTVVLVRRRWLSLRYGLGWLTVSIAGIVAGPLLAVLAQQAKKIGFTPTGFSLGVFVFFLILLCLQLSISLSGLHRAIQDLSEHAALMEERVNALEAEAGEAKASTRRYSEAAVSR